MKPTHPNGTAFTDNTAPQRPMRSLRRPMLRACYIAGDCLAAAVAWVLFLAFRKHAEGVSMAQLYDSLQQNPAFFYRSLTLFALFWCLLHSLFGYYKHIYRKNHTSDFSQSLKACFTGTLILLFLIILDDDITSPTDYYLYTAALFAIYFPLCVLTRWTLTFYIRRQLRHGSIGINTLIVGDGPAARHFVEQTRNHNADGLYLKGYTPIRQAADKVFPLPYLGRLSDLEQTLHRLTIEEVFVFPEAGEENALPLILSQCLAPHLIIHIHPSTENILLGTIHQYSVKRDPFIILSFDRMPFWQRCIRRGFEIIACTLAGLLLSPLLIYAACRVRRSSPGPIIYKQERLGLHGKPFTIYKLRSMYINAETDRPLLATEHDTRITPWGRIMRKYRIDELPQLYNILKGDMTLVGPRPERAYFVEQIAKTAPHYRLLFNVKPGLTSWGAIRYGYAENVPEMVERLAYDIVYLENQSLTMDLKILIYTIGVVLKGKGQ